MNRKVVLWKIGICSIASILDKFEKRFAPGRKEQIYSRIISLATSALGIIATLNLKRLTKIVTPETHAIYF